MFLHSRDKQDQQTRACQKNSSKITIKLLRQVRKVSLENSDHLPAVIFIFLRVYLLSWYSHRILNCNLLFSVAIAVSGEVSASDEVSASGEVFAPGENVVFTILITRLLAISIVGCTSAEGVRLQRSYTSAEDESPSNTNEAVSLQFLELCQFLHWNETATRKDNVTADQAKAIAFTHAGLTKAEVTSVKAKLDTDDIGKNIVNQRYPIFQSFTSIHFFLIIFYIVI